LNHIYFEDLATKTKFKSRYPTNTNEEISAVVIDLKEYQVIVEKLHEQILEREIIQVN